MAEPELVNLVQSSPEIKEAIETHFDISQARNMANFISEVLAVDKRAYRVHRLQLMTFRRALRANAKLASKLYEENQVLKETIEKMKKESDA